MANEFFLKINTDSKGNRVSLDGMSIEAADVLKVCLASLSDLANAQENPDELKISLRNSSVGIALEFPETDAKINSGIDDVLYGRSLNNQYFKTLRTIQDRVKSNGFSYEVVYTVNDVPRDLTEEFESKSFSRKLGSRREKTDEVVFLKGYIYQAGGKKNTNLHLTVNEEDITVNCSQDQAKRFEKILYTDILFCALKTNLGDDSTYQLIDSYVSSDSFLFFKNFYESINNDSLERFDIIIDKIIEVVDRPRMRGDIVKLLRLFNYPQADRGNLRTVLVALKSMRHQQLIAELYDSLANYLRAGSTHKVI